MTLPCSHCGTPFEPGRSTARYCSKECRRDYWNRKWEQDHPYPAEHYAWRNMRKRCLNPNHHAYRDYGGRGITICARWDTFEAFFEDMGPRPTPQHSLDRIDNELGYTPENCKWGTKSEQSQHRRTSWSAEDVETLKCWHATGLNFSQIQRLYLPHKGQTTVAAKGKRLGLKPNYDNQAPRTPALVISQERTSK